MEALQILAAFTEPQVLAAIVATVAALAIDTSLCAYFALVVGPKRAAERVKLLFGDMFDTEARPRLERMLHELRGHVVAHVDAQIVAVTQHVDARIVELAEKFDSVRDEAREEAAQRIAAARADLEAEAQRMREQLLGELEAEKDRLLSSARGAELGRRSGEVRNDRALQLAQTKMQILAVLTDKLGPFLAERVIGYAERAAPKEWKLALANPDAAPGILGPLVAMAERGLQANHERAAAGAAVASDPASAAFGW